MWRLPILLLVGSAIVVLGAVSHAADDNEPASDVTLTGNAVAHFAGVDEGRTILANRDRFVAAQTAWDRQARLKSAHDVSADEYLKFVAGEVLAWDAADREKLGAAIAKVRERLRPWKLPFPRQIALVRTTGKEEGGAAYCRGSAVVLPKGIVDGRSAEALERLLLHELFHVLSSHNEALRERLYGVIGFARCGEIELPDDLAARKITNPDAPTIEHRVEIAIDEQPVEVVPILLADAAKYDATARREFFAFMKFRLLAVAKDERGHYALRLRDDKPWLIDPAAVPSYHEKIGHNTGYIIHPEEIIADNFVLVMLGEENVKTPRILEAMRAILRDPSGKQ
ncbi:MAG: hypothetical protein WD875_14165 [Pirellulales bacterium]